MEIGEATLLFDIGPGTMHRLLESGYRVTDIDFIFVSHFHPDHTGELASFLFANKYPDPKARKKPLTLAGGAGFKNFYEKLAQAWPGRLDLEQMGKVFELRPAYESPCFEAQDFLVFCLPAAHQPESVAFKVSVQPGPSAVYTGDTDYSPEIIKLARDADLMICEAALPDDMKVEGHMTPSLAGKTAAEAGVGSLVLTHFYPECENVDIKGQCRRTYQGPLRLARDLMKIELPENKAL